MRKNPKDYAPSNVVIMNVKEDECGCKTVELDFLHRK